MRAMLGRFGLSGHHHLQPIVKLSGGQKARVVFTAIALSNPHILLLDEPTNHLDMQSIDALADALEEFEGGVVIISHDARLLSRICDDAGEPLGGGWLVVAAVAAGVVAAGHGRLWRRLGWWWRPGMGGCGSCCCVCLAWGGV